MAHKDLLPFAAEISTTAPRGSNVHIEWVDPFRKILKDCCLEKLADLGDRQLLDLITLILSTPGNGNWGDVVLIKAKLKTFGMDTKPEAIMPLEQVAQRTKELFRTEPKTDN